MKRLLDHGYIKLVETWGSDQRIIESARMSTGKGFLGWGPKPDGTPGDEKLLRYLWEHKHSTPFEMAGATIEVQAPIFVFREWHRHRTQCLAGDTMIMCVSPRGTTYQRSIKSIFDLKYGGVEDSVPRVKNGYSKAGTPVMCEAKRKVPWRTRVLPNCQSRVLRVLNEATGEFETAPMADVWESGVKTLYRLTTETGRTIKASAEHPFYTRDGWKKLKELRVGDEIARMGVVAAHDRPIPPALRSGIGAWTAMMRLRLIKTPTDFCYLCDRKFEFSFLELDHVVPVSEDLLRALDVTNLRPICPRCHKNKSASEQPCRKGMTHRGVRWERVAENMLRLGDEMTYDIEVSGAHHNYVANGLVVHNSYSELSARYTEVPELFYMPSDARLANAGQSKTNKQGSAAATFDVAEVSRIIDESSDLAFAAYKSLLDTGVAREIARLVLPVNAYSRMRASANLRNWLGFLALRLPENAQYEIRVYAEALKELLYGKFPRTLALFEESIDGVSKT